MDKIPLRFLRRKREASQTTRGGVLATEATVIDARSDHFAFCVSGIPCGGLFTGAEGIKTAAQAAECGGTEGEQYDPCYHLACDTFDNNSNTALGQMSDAAAFAILTFSMNTESVNGVAGKGNFKPQNQLKAVG